ncbi:hypothetical protein L6452_12986 [Arctium lappa]|uniref:Uncharacterized protein n=1 Tax=Arctium lappa TaxID=4217 RepID=A0ACB9CH15_ARCLA|nr:hypothetical protein L6452_12986 [Arctium lappa]
MWLLIDCFERPSNPNCTLEMLASSAKKASDVVIVSTSYLAAEAVTTPSFVFIVCSTVTKDTNLVEKFSLMLQFRRCRYREEKRRRSWLVARSLGLDWENREKSVDIVQLDEHSSEAGEDMDLYIERWSEDGRKIGLLGWPGKWLKGGRR